MFPPIAIDLIDLLFYQPCSFEFLVFAPQAQRRAGVFDAVVVARLDVFFKEEIGQEAEFEGAFALLEEEAGVDGLGCGDEHVGVAEVGGETVADEDAAEIEEEPEFLVG